MMSHSAQRPTRGPLVGWLITSLTAAIVVAAALEWRGGQTGGRVGGSMTEANKSLPRTRKLIEQKTASLLAYNEAISTPELVAFLSRHVRRDVSEESFAILTEFVTSRLVPAVWTECNGVSDERAISHQTISHVLAAHFPREVLTNADVILFPRDAQFRTVVAEAPQDHFRDSAWHWRWIGESIDRLDPGEIANYKEIETYAAEELSEFLSVFAVGVFEIVARFDRHADGPLSPGTLRLTLESLDRWSGTHTASDTPEEFAARLGISLPSYSEEKKKELSSSLPEPMFRDISKEARLDFMHRPKLLHNRLRFDLEVPMGIAGGGVSCGDFDGDGWIDLYLAGDRGGRLFRNVGGKQFEDATFKAGLKEDGESRAGYFVDYDNDGDADLYVTFVGESNRLYDNNGTGNFVDITDRVGLTSGNEITHEAAWFDMDRDGLLDLCTATFGDWLNGAVPTLGRSNDNAGPNRFYRHRMKEGRHWFEEVGGELNVDDRGWTHCIGVWDYDQDGYLDLFSLNDFGASLVYRNVEGKSFEETSRDVRLDACYNAMNYTLMDLHHDGRLSFYVTQVMKLTHRQRYRKPEEATKTIFTPASIENLRPLVRNLLYMQGVDGVYENVHDVMLEPSDLGWAWGANAFDYENDGDLELLVLNGTESKLPMYKNVQGKEMPPDEYFDSRVWLRLYRDEENVVYASDDGYFYDVSPISGLNYAGNSRGSAFFDFDGDGDLDVAVNNYSAPALLFENRQEHNNHWIRFRLEGTKSNRDAIGALVKVYIADQVHVAQVCSRTGFLSQDPRTIHFGLGDTAQVDKVLIQWPSGREQILEMLPANQTHDVVEP